MFDPSKGMVIDLAVVGGCGPAGLAVVQQVSGTGLSVCSIDLSPKLMWPNNYGVWVDEFDAMDLLDCLDTSWSRAIVYVDDSLKKALDRPYGRYGKPYSLDYQVAYEGTSLVARPGVAMEDIQERMAARLRPLGIRIKGTEEGERCIIPMGGPLLAIPQRVVGIGVTAEMVQASTDYMVARTLAAAPTAANSIIRYLGSESKVSAKDLSAKEWKDLRPIERRRQGEFFCFGMDILLKLDLRSTRQACDAFFVLEPHYWHGFLSSRLFLPRLIPSGLSLCPCLKHS
ncbi:hypothetical protein Ancab_031127 [Ancistrocladus abbreviatus]